jgi:uncharacterized membrane protein HdeD (DUF308 family)
MNDVYFRSQLASQWGWIALRGLAAVSFGVMAFVWPEPTLVALTLVCGAYVFVDGVIVLMAAFRIRDQHRPLWPLVIVGVLGVAAGAVTFVWPDITALSLLLVIAAWALVMGAFQIASAIHIRKTIDNEWMLGLSGVVSMIFGAMIFFYPQAGALAVAWMIGAFAIPFGLLLIMLGFRLRRYATLPESRTINIPLRQN